MSAWMERVGSENYRYIQEVFSEDNPTEQAHLRNCKVLVRKGLLQSEDDDRVTLGPFTWDAAKRYCTTF